MLPTHGIGLSRESTRCWLMIAVTNSAEGIILVVFGTPIAFAITRSLHLVLDEDPGSLRSTAWVSNPSAAPPASQTADPSIAFLETCPLT